MGVDANMPVVVKTSTKIFYKDTFNNMTNYWAEGFYLSLKIKYMVPRERLLISIGCKYNYWEVISFIDTYGTGSTKAGTTYLSKYPDHFSNVSV